MKEKTRIPIMNFVIKADAVGWMVGKPYSYWNKKAERNVERFTDVSYHATFQHAVESLANKVIHESAAQSLKEVKEVLENLQAEIREGLKIEG